MHHGIFFVNFEVEPKGDAPPAASPPVDDPDKEE